MSHGACVLTCIPLLSVALVGCGGIRPLSTDWPDATPRQRGALDGYKPVGPWKTFHRDGSLASEGLFTAEGRQDGRWTYGHPGGTPAGVGHWRGGIQHGWWETYATDHALTSAGLMWEGRRIGPWILDGTLRPFGSGTITTGVDTIRWSRPPQGSVDWLVATTAVAVEAHWDGAGSPWNGRFDDPGVRAILASRLGGAATEPAASAAALAPSAEPAGGTTAAAAAIADDVTVADPRVELTPLPPLIEYNAAIRLVGRTIRNGFVGDLEEAMTATPAAKPSGTGNVFGRPLVGKPLPQTRFLSSAGGVIDLARPQRTTVAVIMRGFSGSVCLYCAGQTAALADAAGDFAAAGIDLVVIYPGPTNTIPGFVAAVQELRTDPPAIPLALDVNLLLVQGLGIADDLAKPTTLVLDRSGTVTWAHVGTGMSDRPTVADILTAARATP